MYDVAVSCNALSLFFFFFFGDVRHESEIAGVSRVEIWFLCLNFS